MFADINMLKALLYVLGIVLLIVEGVVPGFGIAGVTGIICVLASIIMITNNLYGALLLIIGTVVIVLLLLVLLYKLGFANRFMGRLVLKEEQKNEKGYKSAGLTSSWIGMTGMSISELRPAGTAEIDGKRMDVMTEGEFIERNVKVEVIKINGASLVVKKASESEA